MKDKRKRFISGGYGNITIEGVKWSGWSESSSNQYGLWVDAPNCTITKCRWDAFKGYTWLCGDIRSHNLEVSYCDFWNYDVDTSITGLGEALWTRQDRDGTVSTVPQNHHIHHNHFRDATTGGGHSSGFQLVTLYCDEYSTENPAPNEIPNVAASIKNGTIFEHNLFDNCTETLSNKQRGMTTRYNTLIDCGTGIAQRLGDECDVYGNTIYISGNTGIGISVNGQRNNIYNNFIHMEGGIDTVAGGLGIKMQGNGYQDGYYQYDVLDDSVISFNTIMNSQNLGALNFNGYYEDTPSQNVTVTNNILLPRTAGNAAYNSYNGLMDLTGINISNNIYQELLGNCGTVGTSADPEIRLQFDDRYAPIAGSYCLELADATAPAILTDIYGEIRPSPRTVGASGARDTYSINTNPVLNPSDVGTGYLEEKIISVASISAEVSAVTEPTILIVTDGNIDSSITLSGNNYPVTIKAQNSLGVKMNHLLQITYQADNITLDGILFEHVNSGIKGYGEYTTVTRCRFDGTTGGGHTYRWVELKSNEDSIGDLSTYSGRGHEISYCEFDHYLGTSEGYAAKSPFFLFAYLDWNVPMGHSIHHNYFNDFRDNDNGSESISLYTGSQPGSWSSSMVPETFVDGHIKIYNNLWNNCHSDGEIIKSGLKGTEIYDNTVDSCSGVLSQRVGGNCHYHHNIIFGSSTYGKMASAITPNYICEYNIAIDMPSNTEGIKFLYEYDSNDPYVKYEGGYDFIFRNNFFSGGLYGFRAYSEGALAGLVNQSTEFFGTFEGNVFECTGADQILRLDDYVAGNLSNTGNMYYGAPLGAAVGGFTELLSAPIVPDTSHRLTYPADVGVNA